MMYISQFFLAAAGAAAETSAAAMDMVSAMNNGMTTAEKLSMSGQMLADGLGTVFLVLIVLWGVLSLFRLFFYDIPNRSKGGKPAAVPAAEEETEETPLPVQEQTQDDTELAAVLTAAVAAYMEAENQTADAPETSTAFRVVSFKRAKHGNGWNKSGR